MEKRRPRVEDVVIFHDTKGKAHNALVKCVFDQMVAPEITDEEGNITGYEETRLKYAEDDLTDLPLVNLVHVSSDPDRQDGCGRQTEVPSSVPHANHESGVHGYYWRFVWEEPVPYRAPSDV